MDAKKATKAALDIKEAAMASEDMKKSIGSCRPSKGHCRPYDGHGPHGGHGPQEGHGAVGHNEQKEFLKEDSYFIIHQLIFVMVQFLFSLYIAVSDGLHGGWGNENFYPIKM